MNGKLEFFNIIYNFFEVCWNRLMFVFFSYYLVYVWEVLDFEGWSFIIIGRECLIIINDLFLNIKYIVSVCVCVGREIGFFGYESDEIFIKNLVFKIKF